MNNRKNIFSYFIIVFLFACSGHSLVNIPDPNSTTVKRFETANEISYSWSDKNSVVYHVIAEPDNLHPTNGNSSPRSEILQYTQRTLMYIDFSSGDVIPGLVKSLPEISEDGLQYTYQLRDDIRWDNDSLLSVYDIIFTAKAFKCPLTNNPSIRSYWENIDNIIFDPAHRGRFTVIMKRRHIQNITFFTGFSILQQTFYDPKNILSAFTLNQFNDTSFHATTSVELQQWAKEFNDDKYGRDPQMMNGLGMYKVTEWVSGQYITLDRKKNHWSQLSHDYHEVSFPGKIIFKLNKDEASQRLEFRSQAMDVSINIPVSAFLALSGDESFKSDYNYAMMPTYNYTYICFNEKPDGKIHKRLFDDVKVRRALAMITPVDNIVKLIYKDYGGQCKRIISNVSPLKKEFYSDLKPVQFNIESSEKLLADAGWTDTDGDGVLDKIVDGEKINLSANLNYLSSTAEWKDMALLIAEEMAKAGVQIIPVPMELKLFVEKAKSHDFDLMLGSWGGSGLPEDYTQLWHTSSWSQHGSNYSGFGNTRSDALIDSIKYELDDSKRATLSHSLQQMIYDDQPYVFLYSSLRRSIVHKRFGNQMLFSERPGILVNMLQLLSIKKGITINDEVTP